ncbi:UNVERIFIED_CONTAM: Vacuolar protein sorting-associated protein 54, chloroplastic [Sesamum radiatum]|uniref:Vacuolar protein sorting-associated protein 54, chloroplastic n=1 Tax=Sesamum radiatum TaxID=300843 RepID=A0AAW2LQK2_SESRA
MPAARVSPPSSTTLILPHPVVGWWSSSTAVPGPRIRPSALRPNPDLIFTRSDFIPYLSSVSESHSRFVDILRQHDRDHQVQDGSFAGGAAGEAFGGVLEGGSRVCIFKRISIGDGATFRAACPFRTISENVALQERLSQYLDVVELHLGAERVRELKETIRLLDSDLVGSARKVQELSKKRGDLIKLQNKLRLVLSVNQAISTLQLLVASADCLGALDITDDLQHLLDGDELIGLHCFRHLRDHVTTSVDSINSILSAEFIRASLRGAENMDVSVATSTFTSNGRHDDVRLEEEQTSNFQDQLLPLTIGLLRTINGGLHTPFYSHSQVGQITSCVEIYRDTLASDIKTSVKMTVLIYATGSDFSLERGLWMMVGLNGGGSSLGSKLKSLSPDSFLKLLEEIFKIVQTRLLRASEVKKAIEWIMGNLNGHYAAASVAAAIAHGAAAPETANEEDGRASSFSSQSPQNATRVTSTQGRGYDTASPNLSKNFRADILRENAEALFAACDAAHGRWAKIVGIRSQIHPKLKLQEFLSVYNISQEFISSTEKVSGLRSITARHLAMASQVISFTYAIIPEIRRILLLKVPETYKGLLQSELDRVATIMRERLLVHLRSLPQIVERWNRSEDTEQPSQFARSLTKEVGYLLRTLSKHLLEDDVQAIFGQVVVLLHTQISDAFSRLEISTPQAKSRCQDYHIQLRYHNDYTRMPVSYRIA